MNDNLNGQSFSSLPRPQKTAVIILSIVAVGIIGVWFWQFNMRLNKPFLPTDQEMARGKKTAADQLAAANALKTKDSDGDGLIDYDETNVYHTSPYLEDTDGDGIADGVEISLGQDPLCNEKTGVGDCGGATSTASFMPTTVISTSTVTTTPADTVDQALLVKALSGQGDAATMRQILLQAGGNPIQINSLSDADLMSLYQDVLNSQDSGAATTSVATSSIINK